MIQVWKFSPFYFCIHVTASPWQGIKLLMRMCRYKIGFSCLYKENSGGRHTFALLFRHECIGIAGDLSMGYRAEVPTMSHAATWLSCELRSLWQHWSYRINSARPTGCKFFYDKLGGEINFLWSIVRHTSDQTYFSTTVILTNNTSPNKYSSSQCYKSRSCHCWSKPL